METNYMYLEREREREREREVVLHISNPCIHSHILDRLYNGETHPCLRRFFLEIIITSIDP